MFWFFRWKRCLMSTQFDLDRTSGVKASQRYNLTMGRFLSWKVFCFAWFYSIVFFLSFLSSYSITSLPPFYRFFSKTYQYSFFSEFSPFYVFPRPTLLVNFPRVTSVFPRVTSAFLNFHFPFSLWLFRFSSFYPVRLFLFIDMEIWNGNSLLPYDSLPLP